MPIDSNNYTKTISSTIFSQFTIVSEFELDWFMENVYPCDCRNSPFVSEHHGHVITGNIYIVSNEAPRGLISKGPKFREQNKTAWEKTKIVYYHHEVLVHRLPQMQWNCRI